LVNIGGGGIFTGLGDASLICEKASPAANKAAPPTPIIFTGFTEEFDRIPAAAFKPKCAVAEKSITARFPNPPAV
jgi:hypothetical protein